MDREDKIFVPGHLTDFEKLLFSQREVKDLKLKCSKLEQEVGKLQSYIQELEFEKKSLTPEEKTKLKQDLAYQKIRKDLTAAEKMIAQLRKDRDELINRLHK